MEGGEWNMGAIIAWILLLLCTFGGDGNNFWFKFVLWGGIVLFVVLCISVGREDAKAEANRRHYWAHYYDNK